ncbi:MFS transporter [Chelonobacter oris]|uniref:MFS transporter n=1 Tax=Chelonobacter oris TaxID=505317 RepID=UPI0024485928|nr:MFS transporter [Chelonobacter oris]MDH3000682.1 MFS transporter [Chelonobacter oris]
MNKTFFYAFTVAFLLFLAIVSLGISLAIIPLYINKTLQLSPLFVGIAIATELISTLCARAFAGRFSDLNGPKLAMLNGQFGVLLAGLLFLVITFIDINQYASFLILLVSRVIMGVGSSLIFTSSGTWPIGLVGREHAGKIMSWVGMAMFIGLALGNYIGGILFYKLTLFYPVLIMCLLPLLAIVIAVFIPKVAVHNDVSPIKLSYAIKRVWKAGMGFALANTGYAAITSFLLLYFSSNGWDSQGPLALSLFGIGYVLSRVILGKYADSMRIKATTISLLIESIGLILISFSLTPLMSMIGSFLAGFGLSMVYPLLALPAIKSLPEKNIGMAISTYESCFDIGILLSGILGGILVLSLGYNILFIFTAICCLISIFFSKLAYKQLTEDNK